MDNTDFIVKMIADLPGQFKGKGKIEGLIFAFAEQLNAVRFCFSQLEEMRSLQTGVGRQLDGIGEIAVLSRDDATRLALRSAAFTHMTDDIYRLYLVQKIMANMTNCTYYDIYNALVILWGRTPIWYSESIDEPATITMTVPALSSADDMSTFLGFWEIRPAGVQMHFTATAHESILINADFRPSAFIVSHIKTGTKPRRAVNLTFEGFILGALLSRTPFNVKHERTRETLHTGTKPTRILFLDEDGVTIHASAGGAAFTQTHDKTGTKPREAVPIGMRGIVIDGRGDVSRFTVEPPQTSETLHTGTHPERILFLDRGGAAVGASAEGSAFTQTHDRVGTQPSNTVITDTASANVRQILDKEVFGIEFTRSGTEPQPSVMGSADSAGITTGINPASFSVKFRKCGTGVTRS